jgi:hypothetical protein
VSKLSNCRIVELSNETAIEQPLKRLGGEAFKRSVGGECGYVVWFVKAVRRVHVYAVSEWG